MRKRKRADGEGSCFRLKSGKWCAVTPPPRVYRYGRTQAEALAKRAKVLSVRKDSIRSASASQPLKDYLRAWLAAVAPDVRVRTGDGYRAIIETHIVPLIGEVRLGKLHASDIQRVMDGLSEKKRSAATRKHVRGILFRALDMARKWDLIAKNPVDLIAVPDGPRRRVDPLPDDAITALMKGVVSDRLAALWFLYLGTALRRGEALAIGLSDLNLSARTVTIRRGLQRVDGELTFTEPKTAKGYRTMEIPALVCEALRLHLEARAELAKDELWHEHGLVFTTRIGTPLEPRNVLRRFHQLLEAAKISKRRLHDVRHTVISILLRRGVDIKTVQEIAGHSRASVTLDTYGHLLPGTTGAGASVMDAELTRLSPPRESTPPDEEPRETRS